MEAAWRLQRFPSCGRSHGVQRLAGHIENQQKITSEENKEKQALDNYKTTLSEWFELNKRYKFSRNIKYSNIP